MRPTEIFFAALRSAVLGEPFSVSKDVLTEEKLRALYLLSKRHDLAHLVSYVLDRAGLLPTGKLGEAFKSAQMLAIYRAETILFAYNEIKEALEEAKIPFISLKGAVLRAYYPEPWMRTSCDIDILIQRERLDEAISHLEARGYRAAEKHNYHDVSLYAPNGVHLELHFSIKENMPQIDGMLEAVWDYTEALEGKQYEKKQTDAYFVFHHLAHMAYHFLSGGCGVKPFLDLYLLRHSAPWDEAAVRALCAASELERFYDTVLDMIAVWFENVPHSAITQKTEAYILTGGVYGSSENQTVAKQGAVGGKLKYFLGRLFPPYTYLKEVYPVLEKHKWLYPFMLVRRFFSYVFTGGLRRGKKEWKRNVGVSREQAADMRAFLQEVGIRVK